MRRLRFLPASTTVLTCKTRLLGSRENYRCPRTWFIFDRSPHGVSLNARDNSQASHPGQRPDLDLAPAVALNYTTSAGASISPLLKAARNASTT